VPSCACIDDENNSEAFSFSLLLRKESQEFQNWDSEYLENHQTALANIYLVSTRMRVGTVMLNGGEIDFDDFQGEKHRPAR